MFVSLTLSIKPPEVNQSHYGRRSLSFLPNNHIGPRALDVSEIEFVFVRLFFILY